MSNTFSNGLTSYQTELLVMLAEEAGEIVQAVTKILRHGYMSKNPDSLTGNTNRTELENELCDFLAVLDLIEDDHQVVIAGDDVMLSSKRKLKWMHHTKESE